MKARLFKIVIAVEFDQEQDEVTVADGIMQALQSPTVPAGAAQVVAVPIEAVTLSREQLGALN